LPPVWVELLPPLVGPASEPEVEPPGVVLPPLALAWSVSDPVPALPG
jgi:hypothetical protein